MVHYGTDEMLYAVLLPWCFIISTFWLKVFVYSHQEVLNGLAHPSWTNNHRNPRNAVRTMLLLLEFISGHSVNYFIEPTCGEEAFRESAHIFIPIVARGAFRSTKFHFEDPDSLRNSDNKQGNVKQWP